MCLRTWRLYILASVGGVTSVYVAHLCVPFYYELEKIHVILDLSILQFWYIVRVDSAL
jgi:hypothetical protein